MFLPMFKHLEKYMYINFYKLQQYDTKNNSYSIIYLLKYSPKTVLFALLTVKLILS